MDADDLRAVDLPDARAAGAPVDVVAVAGLADRAAGRGLRPAGGAAAPRFIKTHTPLDGVPVDPRATYIVVARHPLDMAVSLFHQSTNLNHDRVAELTRAADPADKEWPADRSADRAAEDLVGGPAERPADHPQEAQPPVKDALLAWID